MICTHSLGSASTDFNKPPINFSMEQRTDKIQVKPVNPTREIKPCFILQEYERLMLLKDTESLTFWSTFSKNLLRFCESLENRQMEALIQYQLTKDIVECLIKSDFVYSFKTELIKITNDYLAEIDHFFGLYIGDGYSGIDSDEVTYWDKYKKTFTKDDVDADDDQDEEDIQWVDKSETITRPHVEISVCLLLNPGHKARSIDIVSNYETALTT